MMNGFVVLLLSALTVFLFIYGLKSSQGGKPGEELLDAVRAGNMQQMMVFINRGVDVNYQDAMGNTALIIATNGGFYTMAERLIAQGAEVNAKNCLGETPLMQGTKQNHDKMVLLLLQNGADREMKTRQGWNARLIAEALGSGSVQKLLTQ